MGIAVEGLSKSYGAAEVLSGIDLDVGEGEIHALLGANGAGKSTLIKCLSGATAPSSGRILIDGAPFAAMRPEEARAAGIAVVHQEPSVALSLNVRENIFLGNELRFGPFVRRRAERREARRWLSELGVDLAPEADLADLGNAELQLIEIIKAIRVRPKVLILDEPTAALSEQEARLLGAHLRRLREQGLPMLYVTHRLSEVFALADRVSVLRGGGIVLSGPVGDFTPEEVVDAIVGGAVNRARVTIPPARRRPMLAAEGLRAPRLGPVDLRADTGEILGVFGLVGSGRTELLETLFGAHPAAGGRMTLEGADYAPADPIAAVARGVALVPSDRLRKSVIGGLSARDNMLIPGLGAFGRLGLRDLRREARAFDGAAARLDLRPRAPELEARRFSGGNQQKLVIARWLNGGPAPRLLLLDEPTQGVDVGARKDIYAALRALAATGETAVIVTSSEPEELRQIAHRVLVLADGRVAGMLAGEEVTEARMLFLAHAAEGAREPAATDGQQSRPAEHAHD